MLRVYSPLVYVGRLCFCLVSEERAKSQTHSFWGASSAVLIHVDSSAPRGHSLDGGTIGPLVSRSPEVTPQEKAGRPMGPSTLQ